MSKNHTKRMTAQRLARLSYIARHPGASAADVDRGARTARGGHRWTYAALDRDVRAGLVTYVSGPVAPSRGRGLALTEAGARALGGAS